MPRTEPPHSGDMSPPYSLHRKFYSHVSIIMHRFFRCHVIFDLRCTVNVNLVRLRSLRMNFYAANEEAFKAQNNPLSTIREASRMASRTSPNLKSPKSDVSRVSQLSLCANKTMCLLNENIDFSAKNLSTTTSLINSVNDSPAHISRIPMSGIDNMVKSPLIINIVS